MAAKYTFDDKHIRLTKAGRNLRGIAISVLRFVSFTLALAVVSYLIFAIFFSTDTERRLRQENRMYSKVYPEMKEKEELLGGVVAGLQSRDNGLYKDIFHTDAPTIDVIASANPIFSGGKIETADIVSITGERIAAMEETADRIEDNFRAILDKLGDKDLVIPPMNLPLRDFNYRNTGTTLGNRINPFYKVAMEHHGIDLIVPTGTSVYSAAPGVVTDITRSGRGQGNVVEVTHEGGYVTRYAHLDQILVHKGRSVDGNTIIGKTGMSGHSFAPHLHYEVLREGEAQDPVNYFFSSLSPDEYARMLVIAATTGQSMD